MKDSVYDQTVNETLSTVTTKTTEIGQKTWGIMKGVMAMASQKVEEYSKEGMSWKMDDWPRKETEKNGYYEKFRQGNNGLNSSQETSDKHYNAVSSWDDWDEKETKEKPSKVTQSSESWAGWDDGDDDYKYSSSNKVVNQNGKSSLQWSNGGFL